jgi:hypothetical protein
MNIPKSGKHTIFHFLFNIYLALFGTMEARAQMDSGAMGIELLS